MLTNLKQGLFHMQLIHYANTILWNRPLSLVLSPFIYEPYKAYNMSTRNWELPVGYNYMQDVLKNNTNIVVATSIVDSTCLVCACTCTCMGEQVPLSVNGNHLG